jgi:hypothetical protein
MVILRKIHAFLLLYKSPPAKTVNIAQKKENNNLYESSLSHEFSSSSHPSQSKDFSSSGFEETPISDDSHR